MTIPKFRAVILVFLVGFALGLSVFAASRLFVRSVLNADALATAEKLADEVAKGASIAPNTLPSVVRYTYFALDGSVLASAAPSGDNAPMLSVGDASQLAGLAGKRGAVIDDAPLVAGMLGLAEAATKRVAVPVTAEGETAGTLVVEVDQRHSLESLTRAFAIIGMVTVGLAVLAVMVIAFVVTRGNGFSHAPKTLNPQLLPRDPLTDLPTRSGLTAVLEDAVERAADTDGEVWLMIVGLDGFRAVNAIWGHAAGDVVLQMAAERLKPFGSGHASVARVAGDEFAVIVEGEAAQTMRSVADDIRAAIAEPFEVEGSSILLGASIGAALYPINAADAQFLFRAADSALSKAKSQGRGSLAVFDTEMKERMQRNAALERDMRTALQRDEFVVFYQPQFDLVSGTPRGYEALVRWERPEGILRPRDFLALAEDTGLVRQIGEWVLRKACEDAASWLDSGTVAVNVSAAQFRSTDVEKKIASVLADTGLAAERLEIEVPESLFLQYPAEMIKTLERIKALGVRVAIDSFGSSYAGLAALTQFPFDKVKIDRSFVDQLTEDPELPAIFAALTALGRTLSVDVTAEGVETNQQVTLLKAAGCSIAQGFLFGSPNRRVGGAQVAAGVQAEGSPAQTIKASAG